MKPLLNNNKASVVPVILFLVTIFACGALYSLLFIEIGLPLFEGYIPAGDAKTFIMMCMYAVPLFIILIGVLSLFLAGLKRYGGYGV